MLTLRFVRFVAAVALLVAPALNSVTLGQAKKSDAVVKIAATTGKPDSTGVQTVTITLDHEKTWHTYANPVGNKDLDGAQTIVAFTAKQPVAIVKEAYPKGKLEADKTVGDYYIYEDKVTLTFQIKRTPGDTSPLEATLKFQSCNGRSCLLPASIKVPVQ